MSEGEPLHNPSEEEPKAQPSLAEVFKSLSPELQAFLTRKAERQAAEQAAAPAAGLTEAEESERATSEKPTPPQIPLATTENVSLPVPAGQSPESSESTVAEPHFREIDDGFEIDLNSGEVIKIIPGTVYRNIYVFDGKTINADQTITGVRRNDRNRDQIVIDITGSSRKILSATEVVEKIRAGSIMILPPSHPPQPEVSPVSKRVEWESCPRQTEVMSVGDLSGNFQALRANLIKLNLIEISDNNEMRWAGGKAKLVFHGDILADRHPHGLDCFEQITSLSEQAERDGGQIDIIAGNHDDFLLSFLMGRSIAKTPDPAGRPNDHSDPDASANCKYNNNQGLGLLELCRFSSNDRLKNVNLDNFINLNDNERDEIWKLLENERVAILENMRAIPAWRRILENLCQLKLAVVIDDSLFIHTTPTLSIVTRLLQNNDLIVEVDKINQQYQDGLKKILLLREEPEKGFDELRDIFLDTGNDSDFWGRSEESKNSPQSRELAEKIRNSGVNAIFHGHRLRNDAPTQHNILIASVDMHAMLKGNNMDERSVLRIRKDDGKVQLGKDLRLIRE